MTDRDAVITFARAMAAASVPAAPYKPTPMQKATQQAWLDLANNLTPAPPPTPDPPAPPPTPPHPAAFPTPESTGWAWTGTTLKAYTGPSTISVAGTVLQDLNITTPLKIAAANVAIVRCKISGQGDYGINQQPGASGLAVTDTEITSRSLTGSADPASGAPIDMIDRGALICDQATLTRVLIHGTWRGVSFRGTTGAKMLLDSYIGDNVNPSGNHSSAVNTDGGTSQVTIDHCTLRTAPNTHASSAISVYPQTFAGGSNDHWTITNCLLDTAGGYAAYLGGDATSPKNTNMVFASNRFGQLYYPTCGQYGPCASWDQAGNVWNDNAFVTGVAVPEP